VRRAAPVLARCHTGRDRAGHKQPVRGQPCPKTQERLGNATAGMRVAAQKRRSATA